ncbi:MAG: alpha/beta fold hydrolase [Victivallales bacterium]
MKIFILMAATLFTIDALPAQQQIKAGEPKDISFKSNFDGSEQKYVQIIPAEFKKGKGDLMIALHGHGSDRWQYIKDGRGECKGARDVAAKHKMIYVSPDYRGNSWMGPAAEADIVQIIEEFKKTYDVKRIFLVGGSMGGTSVMTFATLHPDLVSAVSSQNGLADHIEFNSFQDAISLSFGGSKAEKADEYRKRSSEFHADKLKMPISITVSKNDNVVPPDSIIRLGEQLKKTNRNVMLLVNEKNGHATSYDDTVKAIEFIIESVAKR